jgi:hypothetical protein
MSDDSSDKLPRLARPRAGRAADALEQVEQALHGLQYGQVTVIVQDGVVVQVERTDRMRLPRQGRSR